MANESRKEKNKSGKRNKWIIFVICIVTSIIVLVNVFSILVVCVPSLFEKIIPNLDLSKHFSTMTKKDQIESSILSSCVSIIALAVAIWTGINIINAIERKDFRNMQNDMDELKEDQIKLIDFSDCEKKRILKQEQADKERCAQQDRADKEKVLNELYKTFSDESTKVLIKIIKDYTAESNISFLEILEVERLFRNVYFLHDNSMHSELVYYADEGIKRATDLLKATDDSNLKLYLNYRIAEFNFYSGYCCEGDERAEKFLDSIKIYKELATDLGANLPEYKENEMKYPIATYEGCNKSSLAISAYICNTIGEAYSKIIEKRELIHKYKDQIIQFGLQAVFYCAYAVHWNEREIYLRNLGCALERHYGASGNHIDQIVAAYEQALNQPDSNTKSFKTLLSIYDKYINDILGIRRISPSERRTPPLSDDFYAETWRSSDKKGKVTNTMNVLGKRAVQAKKIYPSSDVGYTYSCIYHRDICTLSHEKNCAKKHLVLANKDLEILQIISPNTALTKILKSDLEDLTKKIVG